MLRKHPLRLFTLLLSVIPLTLAADLTNSVSAADRPNVLFIISDDLSASALGCYGNHQCKTPNIDELAARSMQFNSAYCQYPVCGPSRAALMSGMFPQSIGVTGNGSAKNFTTNLGDRPSMTQLFKRNGYYTARVSKIYHMRVPGDITAGVDGPDHIDSWTERFNCQAPEWMSEGEHEHLTNERLKRDRDKHYALGFGGAFYVVKTNTDGNEQPDQMAATKAIELLEEHKDEPFFLAVGLVRPHVPLVAPKQFFSPYATTEMQLPKKIADDQGDIPKFSISKTSQSIGLDVVEKQKATLAAYYASVTYMDAQVGRILAALRLLGLQDNTIVVFTSDHGYHLGEHDLWQKMSLHEESAKIPLLISGPNTKPGSSDSFAQQIDIYPTLANRCGLKIPDHVQGKNLEPILDDPTHEVQDAVYCLRGKGHLLRTKKWALMASFKGPDTSEVALYDMRRDPDQFRNVSKSEPKVVQELTTQLVAKLKQMEKAKP